MLTDYFEYLDAIAESDPEEITVRYAGESFITWVTFTEGHATTNFGAIWFN